jgi:NADH-quinone oxidoreductase subunit D
VPPRATWLRTLLAELNRVLNALLFLGSPPVAPDGLTLGPEREVLQRVMEEASGGRVHYMANRIGGLKEDVPAGWPARTRQAVADVRRSLGALDQRVDSAEFRSLTEGVGVLRPADVCAYGVSGPPARASGVDVDLRRDEPYLAYAELGFGSTFPVVTGSAGDCFERFRCLLAQVQVSLDLADACLDRIPAGSIGVRLPKTVRAPEGHLYCRTENPLGVMGYYLVSRGGVTPWRLAMRTASFNNVSALPALLPGVRLADLVPVLASMFFVIGDLDK